MTQTQIIEALAATDDTQTARLVAALRSADDDALYVLLEKIRVAVRNDAVTDVLVDLNDGGYTDAAEMIRTEYL
jgi:hypothetical protein